MMRKTMTSIISAAVMFGASSLALAASPGVSGQTQLNSSGATANQSGNSSSGPSNSSDRFGNGQQNRSPSLSKSDSASSGTSTEVTDQAQVKRQLEQQGYINVQDIRKDRTGWIAKAKKGGEQVTVNIDSSGQVRTPLT